MSRTWRRNKFGKKYTDKDKFKWELHRQNPSCRQHNGGCPYCEENRLHNSKVKLLYTKMEIDGRNL